MTTINETTFYQVIETLYKGSLDEIVALINSSVYAKEHQNLYEDLDNVAIHTGFSFKTNSGKYFDLLFLLNKKLLIRQPKLNVDKFPQLIGLVCTRKSEFFDGYVRDKIYTWCTDKGDLYELMKLKDLEQNNFNNPITKIKIINDNNEIEEYDAFLIVDSKDKSSLKEFPLSKQLEIILHYGNDGIFVKSIYNNSGNEEELNYDDRDYDASPDDVFFDATDGQVGDLGEDGWTHLGQD